MSGLWQLFDDRREIDPYVFPPDLPAFGEFNDMQHPEFQRTPMAFESERPARGLAPP
jgi:hypothetical protein